MTVAQVLQQLSDDKYFDDVEVIGTVCINQMTLNQVMVMAVTVVKLKFTTMMSQR